MTTGQPEPCPICGSTDVQWRRRRWYDRLRNEVRYWTEAMLSPVFGRPDVIGTRPNLATRAERQDLALRLGSDEEVAALAAELKYEVERELYEIRIASTTPDRFWKCASCGRKGHEFDAATDMLLGRGRLAELEDSMKLNPESMIENPVDRTGLPIDRD